MPNDQGIPKDQWPVSAAKPYGSLGFGVWEFSGHWSLGLGHFI
jgi:hypothetical protein